MPNIGDILEVIVILISVISVIWFLETYVYGKVYGEKTTFTYWIKRLFIKLGWMKNKQK